MEPIQEVSVLTQPASSVGPSRHADRDLRRAWVAVTSLPVALVLAMVVGEGIISALGYHSGGQRPAPIGPALVASVPALLILIAPGVVAVHYGHRAYRAGRREAAVPAWIGGVTAVVVVAQNLLGFLVGR